MKINEHMCFKPYIALCGIPSHPSYLRMLTFSSQRYCNMPPLVKGYIPSDQYSTLRRTCRVIHQLPWQSYPSSLLYSCFCAIFLSLSGLYHAWICSISYIPGGWAHPSWGPTHTDLPEGACVATDALWSSLHGACMIVATLLLSAATSIIPCAACFVAITVWHSRSLSRQPKLPRSPQQNDCTQFVKFKDEAAHARFKGRRIPIETLYKRCTLTKSWTFD
jgi:hypothetical protein